MNWKQKKKKTIFTKGLILLNRYFGIYFTILYVTIKNRGAANLQQTRQ